MKLWEKNIYKKNKKNKNNHSTSEISSQKLIEEFTVGNDHILDQKLVKYDCLASIAHAEMLGTIGVLNEDELKSIKQGLQEIIQLDAQGKFPIKQEEEDCHTAIENYLTSKYGDAGKKIHTARSRNDQVLTALRLYEKKELSNIVQLQKEYQNALTNLIKNFGNLGLPGYTHMQKAMPTTVNTWLGSFLDSSVDNQHLLDATLKIIDQSPLGTAAGFGVPVLNINRQMTSDRLDFAKVMENPTYAQMSRGKFEFTIINSCSHIMFDLNKLATDLILFNMSEFKYINLPNHLCTGSSIMPQKKNPDILELIRAKYHVVLGEEFKVKSLTGNLISGYNRDVQLTKESIFQSIKTTQDCLNIMSLVLQNLTFNEEACKKALTNELYATQKAYELVKKGIPFREAYRQAYQDL